MLSNFFFISGYKYSRLSRRISRARKNVRRALSLAWAASPRLLARYALLGAFSAVMPPLIVLFGSILVNEIVEARMDELKLIDLFPTLLGIWIAVTSHRAIVGYIGYGRNLYVRRVELEAERRLVEKAAKIDLGHFDNSDWHDRLARARRDVSWRPGDLTWSLLGLSGNIVTILLMTGLLATLHWILVLLAVGSACVALLIEGRVTSKLYRYFYDETPEERERGYITDLLVEARSTKEVRAYVLADYLLDRYRKLSEHLFAQRSKIYDAGTKTSLISGLVTGTTLALAYVFVSIGSVEGTIQPGGVVLVIGAFTSVSATLSQITSTFIAIDQHTTFLEDYFSFLSIEPLIPRVPNTIEVPEGPVSSIEFEAIAFSYPGNTSSAIAGLSLSIKSGELIALVGENGAGKSTLIKLLLRFYDVHAGAIRVNGINIKEIDPEKLRSRIGVLFQDYTNYEFSIRESVIMGRPYRPPDDKQVLKALHDSHADWILKKLPMGLDSKVGRLFEGGHDLSGGEWQRLALARIMYRNADIWILDEPTSALDPEAEVAIFAELKENLKGRIGIVISHRFSTVRIADRIAVIHSGHVTELGSHEELLAAGNRYAQLFNLQAMSYK